MDATDRIDLDLRSEAPAPGVLARRRIVFAVLVTVTCLALVAALSLVMWSGGLTVIEAAMIALFAATLPWIVIGLWNAVIGYALLLVGGRARESLLPLRDLDDRPFVPGSRTAIVVPIHDEEPEGVFNMLAATLAGLDATGVGRAAFEVFVLSDTRDDAIAARERSRVDTWIAAGGWGERLHYRRRADNVGFKAGNLRDFCDRHGRDFDFMLVLDADSVMSGPAVLRLVRLMEANPRLGILQTLIVGLPAESGFARVFQYGMRHGMRSYTMGSVWWQGDAGPYWGHNGIIRLRPFVDHCDLPAVPGGPPLGGCVLSHDQVEAVLMRGAGYDVRVLPVEDGSFEANPPTVLDFVKRDLRWCLGNMQYLRLLRMPGAAPLGRVQMILAILMYVGAPCWLGFCLLGLLQVAAVQSGVAVPVLITEPAGLPDGGALGLALFVTVVAITFAPKLFGLAQVLGSRAARRRYGGGARVLAGGAVELVFSALLAPLVATAQTVFLGALLFGKRLRWTAQVRSARTVAWGEAARRLWPQTLFGVAFGLGLAVAVPAALPWAAPFLAGLLLAIPFAVVTASPRLGRWLARARLCATPEEIAPPPEVAAVSPRLAAGR